MTEKILLFIPAYNCEKQIVRVISKINDAILEHINEILVIDNKSLDSTLKAAENQLKLHTAKKVTLIENDENYNFGGSHKIAINYALDNNFTYLIILHGDDQADIKNLEDILKSGIYRNTKLCLGARFHKNAKLHGYSWLRTIGNIGVNILASIITGRKIYDTSAGLNIYKTEIFNDTMFRYFPDDLTFSVFILLYSISKNYSISYFPANWREEDQVSNAKIFKQGWRILKLLLKFLFNKKNLVKKDDKSGTIGTYKIIFKKS